MTEILTILSIGGVLLGIACATYETITQWQTRRRLGRFAAAQRRVSQDLAEMRRAK